MTSFDQNEPLRPSTAPSSTDSIDNRPKTNLLSSLRTSLEPNETFDMFSSIKPNKNEVVESSDDEFAIQRPQKSGATISNLVGRSPLSPVQEPPAKKAGPPTSFTNDFLQADREEGLRERIAPPPSNKTGNLWSDNSIFSSGTMKTIDHSSSMKSTGKSMFDTTSRSGKKIKIKQKFLDLFDFLS